MLGTAVGHRLPHWTSGGPPILPGGLWPCSRTFMLDDGWRWSWWRGGRGHHKSRAERERACTVMLGNRAPASPAESGRAEAWGVSDTKRVPVSRDLGGEAGRRRHVLFTAVPLGSWPEQPGLCFWGTAPHPSIVLVFHVRDVHDGHQPTLHSSPAPQPVGVHLAQHAQDVPLLEAQLPGLRGDVVAKGLHLAGKESGEPSGPSRLRG